MRSTRFQLIAVGLFSIFAMSTAVADDDTGFYIGASANWLSADQADVNDVNFEDSDTAFGARIGYMFSNYVGIEGGYLDLGDYNTEANDKGVDLNLDADGWYAVGVLNFTVLENLDLYGKLGAFFIDANTDFFEFDESDTELYGGVGIEYDFGQFNLFGEFTALDTDVNDLTIDILTVGAKLEFGG